jgi:arginine:pyruvate transaminase
MRVSNRLASILGEGSDGWGVFYKARQMVAQGIEVIELTIGEHDILTDEKILSAMNTAALAGHTGYASIPGMTALRQAVADRITSRTGVETSVDNVLITPGGQAALFAAHMAACDPMDRALFIDPYYATYPGTIRGASAIPAPVQTRASEGFQPDPKDIRDVATGAKSLLINSPNNPTGVTYGEKTLQGIADVCIEKDLWLISDEVYDTQIWEGQHLSPRALSGMRDRTLVVGSMSKSHAMTGSRIGWLVGPKKVIKHLQNLSTHTTYGVAGFVQHAALHALSLGKGFESQISEPFKRRRQLALGLLNEQTSLGIIPSMGGMYIMLDIRSTGLSGEDYALQLLEKHHIAVMPGESFGTAAAGHIRLALTVGDARLSQALKTLIDFTQSIRA